MEIDERRTAAVCDQTCADIPVFTSGELLNLSSHVHVHTCPRIMGLKTTHSTLFILHGVDSGVFQILKTTGMFYGVRDSSHPVLY